MSIAVSLQDGTSFTLNAYEWSQMTFIKQAMEDCMQQCEALPLFHRSATQETVKYLVMLLNKTIDVSSIADEALCNVARLADYLDVSVVLCLVADRIVLILQDECATTDDARSRFGTDDYEDVLIIALHNASTAMWTASGLVRASTGSPRFQTEVTMIPSLQIPVATPTFQSIISMGNSLWLLRHFSFPKDDNSICDYAAWNGHFEILKWLRENGCEWSSNTCDIAAKHGHFEILKWLRDNGCKWSSNTCDWAAENGHFEILKWARENGCAWSSDTCYWAAKNGHFEILKWVRENGCAWTSFTCDWAAMNGHFEILKWARENGCAWTSSTCDWAAQNGHFEILKWARENGCGWSNWTCDLAAENGHFEILKWARENGCDWSHWTCDWAAKNGHFEILKWARENGCA